MKYYFLWVTLFLILTAFTPSKTFSQISQAIFEYSEKAYGTDNFLVNGWKYLPEHYNAEGNPYFSNLSWTEGILHSGEESFENIDMLYNTLMDELIIKTNLENGLPAFVMLNREFVKSFSINQHLFINTSTIPGTDLEGYIELVYDSNTLKFLSKHKKSFVAEYSGSNPWGRISGQSSTHYIYAYGTLTKIPNKKALLNYFEAHKKQVRAFMKSKGIKFKKAKSPELKTLMEYCVSL